MSDKIIEAIAGGVTALGIELGSTRIKSVLIDKEHNILANGVYEWENSFENGLWTYKLEDAVAGLQASYADLAADVRENYGVELRKIGAVGISGMMHGYLALDSENRQLAPFLTWRNTNTTRAAAELTELFDFNVPLRWSISQLYEAILEGQSHVEKVDYITTLAGYIHLLLSGRRVLGIGEASGMFPIDSSTGEFDSRMLDKFDALIADRGYSWDIRDILPEVLKAGEPAGYLTKDGALLLDPSGKLEAGVPMAPPEGDAGTGMTATNAVRVRTGNVSAGTSIFAMIVLENRLSRIYKDIDIVTTPTGWPVAMVHCNNGTSELDAWVDIFEQLLSGLGAEVPKDRLYTFLFNESLNGEPDCGHVQIFNYLSGEPVTGLTDGRPMLMRRADGAFTLANFMRSQIYSVIAAMTIGMRILADEKVKIERLTGHGGLFKTPGVAQRYMAAAVGVPITVTETAGEGGPYGMALLAAYLIWRESGESLEDYLEKRVFNGAASSVIRPDESDVEGYRKYLKEYEELLPVEKLATEKFK